MYQQKPQIAGKAAHRTIDTEGYSTRKEVLQGVDIYCEQYRLCGKIDIFDAKKGVLTERKRHIKTIYDGYVFQVYAHYYGLTEMGYQVNKIVLYDMTANKTYPVLLPDENPDMKKKFEDLIESVNSYRMDDPGFEPNPEKCRQCIYANLCDYGP